MMILIANKYILQTDRSEIKKSKTTDFHCLLKDFLDPWIHIKH